MEMSAHTIRSLLSMLGVGLLEGNAKKETGSVANSDDFQNQGEMLVLLSLKCEHFSLNKLTVIQ